MLVTLIVFLLISFFVCLAFIIQNQRKTNDLLLLITTNLNNLLAEPSNFNRGLQLKEERKAHVLVLAYHLRDAVAKQQDHVHSKAIENLLIHHNINDIELSKLFTAEQVMIIKKYWLAAQSYLTTHWLTQDGKIKTVFKGRKGDVHSELGQLHQASKILVKQLDHWLTELNSSL